MKKLGKVTMARSGRAVRGAAAALLVAFCFTVGGQAAGAEDGPYFDQSAYLKPTDIFLEAEVLVDGQASLSLSDACFAVNNVCYLPLRTSLVACGVEGSSIVWDEGTVSIRLPTGTLEIAIDSDVWTLDGEAHKTRNGHARLRENVTYVPKDMLDEWRIETRDPCLDRLTVNACYSPAGGGLIVY